ncbi:CorA-like protein [delta proteobacterium NaphS2]|nr:CorA-like protein [delta proteobacterium NaphS2]
MLSFRRCVWPLREAITGIQRGGEHLISEELFAFLRDLHDHTVQVMDTLETFHMTISGAMDLYMSSLSNRMNQVAQVLTIVATIFIPLTFIAGVYGMNFKYMPELDLRWAYPACLLLMLLIAALMVLYFKRKKWI